ncbi:MAG: DUF896 domain-containing protein [Ruminococcus sp.]|jgi:uncharacterized protein YnzC (UPF0291/DUF896 family)|nr:DUF896 domain-containing protein [Ruminococcus sp.]
MNDEKIERINFLARKSKNSCLTEDEKAEQQALRNEYRAAFRQSLSSQLDNTYIVEPDGTKRKAGNK